MTAARAVSLSSIADFLDSTLELARIPDYPNALNGVQVANTGPIERIATAVDFSSATVRETIRPVRSSSSFVRVGIAETP